MSEVIILSMTASELQERLDAAVAKAALMAAKNNGELWTVRDVADHYKVSQRTISNWEREGRIAPRTGTLWRKADILQWDSERTRPKAYQRKQVSC